MMLGNLKPKFVLMSKLSAAVFGIIALPMPAMSSTWVFVTNSSSGEKIYEDMNSEVAENGAVTFWNLTKSKSKNGKYYDKFKERIRVNCQNKTIEILYQISYRMNGTVLKQSTGSGYETPVAPDTVGEEELVWACKGH